MSLPESRPVISISSFPRLRGDEPISLLIFDDALPFSPPTRG